ncbi:MAG: hypothetical protein PHY80_00330 [Rickettsiales bacterium]|nr:hypothetical protein [Rickettsiales bacterium]
MLCEKRFKMAFTLLEMSVTILILSIILIGSINFQIFTDKKSKENITIDKIKRIEQSIREYFLENEKLPCPSDLTLLKTNATYGEELRVGGICEAASSEFRKVDLIYGGVPTKTLGLTDDYAVDPWNNRIAYIIEKGYGDNKIYLVGDSETLIINNTSGNQITNKAVYVLVSGGQNKNGVFKDGTQLPINTTLADNENLFSTSFDNIFIKDINTNSFDDIVAFKDKENLIFKDDMESLPCTLKDLSELDSDWNYTSYDSCDSSGICEQGTVVVSLNECPSGKISKNPDNSSVSGVSYRPVRKCLKYGQWSDIIFPCIDGCGESNIASIVTNMLPTSGELASCIDLNYLKRCKLGEEIVLECIGENRIGYITLKCQSPDGLWEHVNGDCYEKEQTSTNVCQNSELNSNINNFTFLTTVGTTPASGVVYGDCSTGYEVQSGGSPTIMASCQADETWSFSGGPCVLPGGICSNSIIDNNTVNFIFPNIASGTTANGSSQWGGQCKTGYGVPQGGDWNLMATCINGLWNYYGGPCAIQCQNSTLNDNTYHFYYTTLTGLTSQGFTQGADSCATGYNIDGGVWNMVATCSSGGIWSYTGGPCVQSCLNSELVNNTLNYAFTYSTTYTNSGATLWGDCADGYTHTSGTWTYTASCSQGVWTYSGGVCSLTGCEISTIGTDLSNSNYDNVIWKECRNQNCHTNQLIDITSNAVDTNKYILQNSCKDGYTPSSGTNVKLYCNSSKNWQYVSGTSQCLPQ